MKKLTNRQADILQMIITYINRQGYPPTMREIGGHFGIGSLNGVNDHLLCLVRKGYIRRANRGARGIAVLRFPDGAEAMVRVTWAGYTVGGELSDV
jgi:repressor LexA